MESGSNNIDSSLTYQDYLDMLNFLYTYVKIGYGSEYDRISSPDTKLTYFIPDRIPQDIKVVERFWDLQGYGYVRLQTLGSSELCYNVYLTTFGYEVMKEYDNYLKL